MKAKRKSDGLAHDSAGCIKCDAEVPMVTESHHKDGSVCVVIQRNGILTGADKIAPLGRYDPAREGRV